LGIPTAIANCRRAVWKPSHRADGAPCEHIRIFVPLRVEETAAVLMVSVERAWDLRAHDPGYSLVDRRWLSSS
jgi:hypothetical protein